MHSPAVKYEGRLMAVLGPTNTGKTHYALERMLSYNTGVIGFPLRLLARENYDRLVAKRGVSSVALITGEEKIIPNNAKYYVCTVESMPVEQDFDFAAIDEIQLCADPDRGHVFTDRLLRYRGLEETLFLGADTIKMVMQALLPDAEIIARERLSTLTYTGFKKITRLPKRSAIVAFSVDDVYAMADLLRRQKGGTAVVMGALSPRTRNKQVEMYQNREVEYLVATDAIGMGLNMDINHVALASLRKFDGVRLRGLDVPEMAQIAGRAGRYKKDGTFGVTGNARNLEYEEYQAIQQNNFDSIAELYWRNHALDFSSPKALLKSLERGSGHPVLVKGRVSDDHRTLDALLGHEDVMVRADNKAAVHLLWDVCQIPDFRKTLNEKHEELVARAFLHLVEGETLPEDWVAKSISQLDRTEGDVDTLMTRIAHIRTWTYITHRKDWHRDPAYWQNETKAIEDRLSDALHDALTKRFVDKRSSVLLRGLEDKSQLLAGVRKDGTVVVEGHEIGVLKGFCFSPDPDAPKEGQEKASKIIAKYALHALKPEIQNRLRQMNLNNNQFTLNEKGEICWQPQTNNPTPGDAVAKLVKGDEPLKPSVEVIENGLMEGQDLAEAKTIIENWVGRHIDEKLAELVALNSVEMTGPARGIAWQVFEGMGVIPRAQAEDLIDDLDEVGRAQLRTKKVRMGPILIFIPPLNKPAAVRLRALLWCLWNDKPLPAPTPLDGVVSAPIEKDKIDVGFYRAIGYPVFGPRAIRIDMLDRVVVDIYDSSKDWEFQAKHQYCEWLGSTIEDLYEILEAMGHQRIVEEGADTEKDTGTVNEASEKAETKSADTATETADEAVMDEKKVDEQASEEKPALSRFKLRRGKMSKAARKSNKDNFKAKGGKKGKPSKKGKKGKGKSQAPKTMQFEIKDKNADDSSPFAILQQLKEKK